MSVGSPLQRSRRWPGVAVAALGLLAAGGIGRAVAQGSFVDQELSMREQQLLMQLRELQRRETARTLENRELMRREDLRRDDLREEDRRAAERRRVMDEEDRRARDRRR